MTSESEHISIFLYMVPGEILFDLTNNTHYRKVRDLADGLIHKGLAEDDLLNIAGGSDLFMTLAAFLAVSRLKVRIHRYKKLRIAVVMNLIHEHHRLRLSGPENPNGENSLENKLAQLEWLFRDTEVEYRLIYLSGGCPWGSDEVLDGEIKRIGTDQVSHIRLDDYKAGVSFIKNQKGGEIIFGIRSVLQLPGYADEGYFDAMLFTDADMTFDLGQLGFLLDEHFAGKDIIIGNRMDPRSVLVKNMVRAGTGVLMYRHIQRKLTPRFFLDLNLHDTQCPWKFLSHNLLEAIAQDLDSMDWSVDTDILSSAEKHGYKLNIVPVTAIDSEMESHGRAIGHYRRNRTIIEGVIHQAQKYGLSYDKGIAVLVEKYLRSDADYRKLLAAGLPESLTDLPNREWGISSRITDSVVEEWLKAIHCGE